VGAKSAYELAKTLIVCFWQFPVVPGSNCFNPRVVFSWGSGTPV